MNSITDQFLLEGKVALVTGAGSGFGEHFAHSLARAGASVICTGRRMDRLQAVVDAIQARGGKAAAVVMDVTKPEAITTAFDEAERHFSTVDVLVNNAGVSDVASFPEMTETQWNNLIDTGLNGPWRVAREMSRRLIAAARGGSIINIASITGLMAKPMFLNYGTAKAGLIHLTRQLAMDLLPHGIRANALAPGYFPTEMTSWYFEMDIGKAEVESLPPKRLGRLEELEGPLLLLASQAGSYINGAVIPVDYGHSVRLS